MGVFLVAYDLVDEDTGAHDYKGLWAELKRLKAHKTQYSLWLVSMSLTVDQVRDHFRRFIDENDRLWVTRLRQNQFARRKAISGTEEWLKANPPEP